MQVADDDRLHSQGAGFSSTREGPLMAYSHRATHPEDDTRFLSR